MSWRGFKKAVERLPANVKNVVGASKLAKDETFELYEARLKSMEAEVEKMLGHTKHFKESATAMVRHQNTVACLLSELYNKNGEFDKGSTSPQNREAIKSYAQFSEAMRDETASDLDLLDSRVIVPLGEIKGLLLAVRKLVVKRTHKLVDLTRHNNTYNSLKNKTTRDVSDEKKMYKYEVLAQDAQDDYDKVNDLLLEELPILFEYKDQVLLPMFQTFLHIQTRFYSAYSSYMDKLRSVAAFDYNSPVAEGFESRKSETDPLFQHLEDLSGSLVRKSSLLSSRLKDRPKRTEKAASQNTSPEAKSSLEVSTSHQRSKSNPPPYAEASSSSSSKIFSTPTSPVKKPPPPAPSLPKARALYDYEPQAEGDLALKTDDIIDIIKKTPSTDDWWTGRLRGKIGIFPANYVTLL